MTVGIPGGQGVEVSGPSLGAFLGEDVENEQMEIERKFLVKELPEGLAEMPFADIEQGYVAIDEERGVEVRLRKEARDGVISYFHTVKVGKGRKRRQPEMEIDEVHFTEFWGVTEGRRIKKRRFFVPSGGAKPFELDIYEEKINGLKTVEQEFDNDQAAEDFQVPEWFGREVTEDSRFNNKSLALKGLPEDIGTAVPLAVLVEAKREIPTYDLERGLGVLVDLIKDKRVAAGNRPIIVQVAGGSASGKTSAVAAKVQEVFGKDARIISIDDYYRGKRYMDEKAEQGLKLNWDHPSAVDLGLLREHIGQLKEGKPIGKPIYSFKSGEREGSETVEPSPIMIIEGLFALSGGIKDEADVRAFVDIGMHGRVMRRLLRDVHRTSMSPRDILNYFAEVVEPMHEQYVNSTKKNADLIIVNEYNPLNEAGRAGVSEVQIKFPVTLSGEELRKAGAERLGKVHQVDYYYNPKDRNLLETGELLRIREEDGLIVLTYKGPAKDSKFRERPKFECEIDVDTRDKFLAMYGERVKGIAKDRVLYKMGEVVIALDDVRKLQVAAPGNAEIPLGKFVELRCDEHPERMVDLRKTIEKLGLTMDEATKKAYSEM